MMDGKPVSDEESDSVEEIISVRPLPTPRLPTYPQNQNHQQSPNKYYANNSPSHVTDAERQYWAERIYQDKEVFTPTAMPDQIKPINQSATSVFPAIIPLNVGGHLYMTRLSTLMKFSDSMLAAMFSGRHQIDKDKDGNFFLDSNGAVFGHILEYLRYGTLPQSDMAYLVFRDANYFGLHALVEKLQLKPEIAALAVKEAQRAQFPEYASVKEEVIKAAMARATVTRVGDVYIYAFRKDFKPKVATFNPKHECIVETAQVTIGPWDAPADEDTFIRCLESDLMEDGFTLRPHEGKKKCKYYFGQSCQKCIYKITVLFD